MQSLVQTAKQLLKRHTAEAMGLLLLPVVAALAWIVVEYQQANGWVAHTLEVETEISNLMATIQEAETGNRGFLLTGDENYLKPYVLAVAAIPSEISRLKSLTADNPDQQRNIAALVPDLEARLAMLERGNDLRRSGGLQPAINFIETGAGQTAMDKVRGRILVMQNFEQELLRVRLTWVTWLVQAGSLAAGISLIIVALAFIAWSWGARREFRELSQLMAERDQNEAQIRQMQKMEAVGQLTGGIAHDFNNMLAVILSSLNLLQKRLKAGDTNVGKFIDAALDGTTRAATLTNRLMAFSRQSPLNPQPLIANAMVSGMTELIQRAIGEAIHVETVLTAGIWPVNADMRQFENAILNLAVNARDAMPDGGKLTLETANCQIDDNYARQHRITAGQYVLVAVSDTGAGMAPEVMAKAFEPFFTTKGVGQGTGLGLAQVHGFIKQSGGHIKIYSEPGHGTTIKIYLPRLYNLSSEESARPVMEDLVTVGPAGNAGIMILVVEDEDRVRDMSVASLR